MNKIENRISLIVKSSSDEHTYEQLLNIIAKSKADVECILIDPSKGGLSSKLQNSSAYKELIEKGRLHIADGYASSLHTASGAISVIIDDITHVNINTLIANINTRKKKLNPTSFYFGSYRNKESNDKRGNFSKLSNSLYNSFARFWITGNLEDHKSGVVVVYTSVAEDIFKNKLSTANSYLQIAHQAAGHEIPCETLALTQDANSPSGGLIDLLSIPFKALILAFNFFVIGAIKELNLPSEQKPQNKGNLAIYRLLFFVLTALLFIGYPILSQDYGMTWDEKQHNDYSQLSYQWFTSFGADSAALADSKSSADYIRQAYRFYGEQMNLVASFVYNTLGTDPFDTRHAINSIYGLLGVLFCGLTVRALTSWRGGVIGLLFLGLNPGWLGFSMNNPTDIPFAAGFAISSYFMVKVLKGMPNPKRKFITGLGIGIGIGIGSRIGAILLIAYMGMFLGIQWLAYCFKHKKGLFSKGVGSYIKTFFSIATLGYLFGIMLWPYALNGPVKNVIAAYKKSSENAFYTNNTELFEGVRMYMLTEAPWYYVIKFLGIGNPLYLLGGIGLSFILLNWIRKYVNIGYILMFIFMMAFPIAWAEYTNLNYYNGWRHYLFVLPAMVVLAAIAYEFLLYAIKNKVIQIGVAIALTIGFGKPLLWIIKNHPNQYVYFNETVGGINGAYGYYETEYYSNSCRAAAEWIAQQEPNKTLTIGINNEPLTASYYAHRINPNLNFVWVREYEEFKHNWDYLILTSRTYGSNELRNGGFPHKGTVHVIEADDIPLCIVVKRENNYMPQGYEQLARQSFDSAITNFQLACEYDPMNEEHFRMLGTAYLMSTKYDSAKVALKKSIEIFPQNYSAYSVLGQVYYSTKQPDSAIFYFDSALHYKRNVTEAYFYAGQCMIQKNDFMGAIKYFEKGIQYAPDLPDLYYYLGMSYANINNFVSAENALLNSLRVNPNFAHSHYLLAQIFEKNNQPQKAQEHMRLYTQLTSQQQ